MTWKGEIGWTVGLALLALIGSSEPGGFGFTVGYIAVFVGVPAWVLTWAARDGDRDLWRRALLLLALLWTVNYLPPFHYL